MGKYNAELANLLSGDTFVVNNVTEKVGVVNNTTDGCWCCKVTSFYGDGSQLEGVASRIGNAINPDAGLDVGYYTDKVLTINGLCHC